MYIMIADLNVTVIVMVIVRSWKQIWMS